MHLNYDNTFQKWPRAASLRQITNNKITSTGNLKRERFYMLKNWEWYEPPENCGAVNFFRHTGLHGLQYLGQRKRHLCERIFWLTAFITAMVISTVLIWKMWDAYVTMPIITVFNPEEKKLNQIPFPAVTICSVNRIRKTMKEKITRDALHYLRNNSSKEILFPKFASVFDVYHICHATKTFTDKFRNRTPVHSELLAAMLSHRPHYYPWLDPIGTLRNASQSCDDMLLYCLWLDAVKNCNELFHPIETDYGLCCTFNTIPMSLLRKFGNDTRDDPQRTMKWEQANLNYDNIILDKHDKRKYPYRQFYPGRSAGLSFLLDSDMDEYYCTNTDSEGFTLGLNVPLDFPRMKDNGIAIRTSTESFISVHPEITMSDESTKSFSLEKRRCYFEGEKKLVYYTKYTASNCMDECITRKTLEDCKCVRYYMPHDVLANETVCHPSKYDCTEKVREKILEGGLNIECNDCLPACTDIRYLTQTTSLRLREQRILELIEQNIDKHDDYEELQRRAKNASIIHVYFNVDSVFPRLRKERTTTVDLISNAGGLLSLCMGFSLLSLLEIIYHGTLRLFCNMYRKRSEGDKETNENKLMVVEGHQSFIWAHQNNHHQHDNQFADSTNGPAPDIFKISKDGQEKMALPLYFRSTFEQDFQRAYFATSPS